MTIDYQLISDTVEFVAVAYVFVLPAVGVLLVMAVAVRKFFGS